MVNPSRQHVVPLVFLQAIRPDLLEQLLARYAGALASLGVPLESGAPSKAWLARFYDALTFENPRVPSPLQEVLLALLDLACEPGFRSLHEHARRLGVDLQEASCPSSHHDFALWAHLVHPKVFRAAHSRFRVCSGLWLAEYRGERDTETTAVRPSVDDIAARYPLILNQPDSVFHKVTIDSLERELVFRFSAKAKDNGNATLSTSDFSETITYDKRTDGLSLSTKDSAQLELYRVAVGMLVGGHREYFQDRPLYTSSPLIELGSSALQTRDIPAIDRVYLVSLTYTDASRISRTDTAPDCGQLDELLDQRVRSGVMQQATIEACRFFVLARRQLTPLLVELRPPNVLWFDRRLSLQHLRDFLIARGFCLD